MVIFVKETKVLEEITHPINFQIYVIDTFFTNKAVFFYLKNVGITLVLNEPTPVLQKSLLLSRGFCDPK